MGREQIKSRAGLVQDADFLIADDFLFAESMLEGIACVLVDEAQFLQPSFVNHLHEISRDLGIPVICYGLRTDFSTQVVFRVRNALLELADSIEEVKSTCHFCNRKAIFNLRLRNGLGVFRGPAN